MKTILFPTDFSEAATRAFIYALHLADKIGARIITLHVYEPLDPSIGTHLPVTIRQIYETIELSTFENYRDSIPVLRDIAEKSGFTSVELLHVMLESRQVIPAILQQAADDHADLIVMGTTGARGLKEIFLGSVAGEVLEKAPCPVLAIPEKTTFDGRIDRVVFTTSFKEEEKKALYLLLDLMEPFQAEVHVVNVDTAHTHFYHRGMDKFRDTFLNREDLRFHVLDGVDILDELTDYLKKHPADILAMVTHQRTFLQELFNYSKAKTMSYHASTPVLSIPAQLLG